MSKINFMGLFNMEINRWWWPSFSFCFFSDNCIPLAMHWFRKFCAYKPTATLLICLSGQEDQMFKKKKEDQMFIPFFHFQLSHFHCNQNYHCYHRNHSLSPFSSSSSSLSSSCMKLYKFVDQLKIELLLCHAGHLTQSGLHARPTPNSFNLQNQLLSLWLTPRTSPPHHPYLLTNYPLPPGPPSGDD